jgi:NADH:ubiquinone oxidoreductase subunit K/NADH:ubiquinone oxidoreductase subunit 6 (subunit J)
LDSLQLLFIATGIVILGSSILVVTSRNLVHAALWLIVTLFGVAVLYTMLNANFLAIVQIVIYIGAIAILFIFAVMLTRKEMRDQAPQLNKFWWLSAFVATMLFILILGMIRTWSGFSSTNRGSLCGVFAKVGEGMIPLSWYLILSAALFCIGLFGVLARRNAIAILLGVELMLNAVNINLISFWRYGNVMSMAGQVFAIIVFAVAAAEVAVGLALIISVYRKRNTVVANDLDMMKW